MPIVFLASSITGKPREIQPLWTVLLISIGKGSYFFYSYVSKKHNF